MYLDYWSLERNPFDNVPDSRSFFPTQQHEQALAAISYATRDAGEPVLITGAAGCGKTLLLRTLRRQLPTKEYQVVFVPESFGGGMTLLGRIAYHLAYRVVPDSAAAMDVVTKAVGEAESAHKSLVVMLDGWPTNAAESDFDELRWLLNLDVENAHPSALLAAEPLDPQMTWPQWLQQRLLSHVQVGPLEPEQISPYIEHRLKCVGHATGQLFDSESVSAIAEWSRCIPRLVNRAAHLALQIACVQVADKVDGGIVQMAFERLSHFADAPVTVPAVKGNQTA